MGTSFRDGSFHDIDADWESSGLTSHVGAPHFEVLLRDVSGRMKADVARTWARNFHMYQHRDSLWRSMRDSLPSWNVSMTRTSGLFANAVLATYCGRAREQTVTLAEARRTLPSEVYDGIAAAVREIVPGALPRRSRPQVRVCGISTETAP